MIGTALAAFALLSTLQCLLVVKLADHLSVDAPAGGQGREVKARAADLRTAGRRAEFA